jgi:hypothetical protein
MATTTPAAFMGMETAGYVEVEWDAETLTLRVVGIA